MSIIIDAAAKAAIDAARNPVAEKNGEALDSRQRVAVKEQVATLVGQGKTDEAIERLLELI